MTGRLMFREVRGSSTRRHADCPPVVELFCNEPLLQGIHNNNYLKEAGVNLFFAKWEGEYSKEAIFSSVTLIPKSNKSDFEERFALYLDTHDAALFHFISSMYTLFRAKLVHIAFSPATFVFEHEGRQSMMDMTKERQQLAQVFKMLVSSMPNSQTVIKVRQLKRFVPQPLTETRQCFQSHIDTTNQTSPRKEPLLGDLNTEVNSHLAKLSDTLEKKTDTSTGMRMADKEILAQWAERTKEQSEKMKEMLCKMSETFDGQKEKTSQGWKELGDSDGEVTGNAGGTRKAESLEQRHTSLPPESDEVTMNSSDEHEMVNSHFDKGKTGHESEIGEDDSIGEDEKNSLDKDPTPKWEPSDLLETDNERNIESADDNRRNVNSADDKRKDYKLAAEESKKTRNRRPGHEVQDYDQDNELNWDTEGFAGPDYGVLDQQLELLAQLNKASLSPKPAWHKSKFVLNKLDNGISHAARLSKKIYSNGAKEVRCGKQSYSRSPTQESKRKNDSELMRYITSLQVPVLKEQRPTDTPGGFAMHTLYQMKELLGSEYGDIWSEVDGLLKQDAKFVPRDRSGTDTIVCLDTCGSMTKTSLDQLKSIALSFIDGIEEIAETHGLEENICFVTIGADPKILHHLSNDYESLRDALGTLKGGGFSPWVKSLITCIAALSKGELCTIGDCVQAPPRFIIITDGITMEKKQLMHDRLSAEQFFTNLAYVGMHLMLENVVNPITLVPYGQHKKSNMGFLQSAIQLCNGLLVEDIRTMCNHQLVKKRAAQICVYIQESYNPHEYSSDIGDTITSDVCTDLPPEDEEKVSDFVRDFFDDACSSLGRTDIFDNIYMRDGLPLLGTRVSRGPDWQWENQDTEGAGTIINHGQCGATMWILWDNGYCNIYRYGLKECYDVLIADDRPRLPDVEGEIYIGMQVERGPHWYDYFTDHDGGPGNYGTVIRQCGKRVGVFWSPTHLHVHSFGLNGRYQVIIRNPEELKRKQDTRPSIEEPVQDMDIAAGRPYVWQWFDKSRGEWVQYSKENDRKLQISYEKRPDGSCLITRDKQNFRVSFPKKLEKSICGKAVTDVRRLPI